MQAGTIVLSGPIEPIAEEILSRFGRVVLAENHTEAALRPHLADAIGLVIRGEGRAGADVITSAPNLRVIGRTGAGYNNVDIETATRLRIPVVFTPGAGSRAVAEGALTFMLALRKNLLFWNRTLKQGQWFERNASKPGDLAGATVGIVGLGRIGQILAKMLENFDVKLLGFDPYVDPARLKSKVEIVDLKTLLMASDVISLHAPHNRETNHLINNTSMEWIKPGACLINMSRGGLIESLDLLDRALEQGQLAGVALDVFDPEPPDVSHPIFKRENCLCAPHILGVTRNAMHRICVEMAEDMAAIFEGRLPRNVVNREVLNGLMAGQPS